jgi:hypothetical protein
MKPSRTLKYIPENIKTNVKLYEWYRKVYASQYQMYKGLSYSFM